MYRDCLNLLVFLVLVGGLAGCGGSGSDSSSANAPTLSLVVSPTVIEPGEAVSIAWSSTGAASCTASGGWSGARPVSGAESVSGLQQPTSFNLSCQGDGGEVSRSVAVTMTEPDPENTLPVISGFQSSPAQVAPGETVTFSWNAADADGDTLRCVLDVTGVGPEFVREDCAGPGTLEYIYDESGTYSPRLRVSDGEAEVSATISQRVVSNFTINLLRPQAGALSDVELEVLATVSSLLEVQRVTATVAGRTSQLVFGNYPAGRGEVSGFRGFVSLEGLPRGEQVVEVIAEDVAGARARVIQSFIYDQPPRLTVSAPLEDTVTARWLRVTASCTDDDPAGCELNVFRDGTSASTSLVSGMNAIDEDFDLSDFDGQAISLRIEARDTAGQRVSTTRRIFVDGAAALVRTSDYAGLVLDLAGQRVLYRVAADEGDSMVIADASFGGVESVPLPEGRQVSTSRSFLTPHGAMFIAQEVGGTVLSARVFDWNQGELVEFGQPNSASSLEVAGDYAIWSSNVVPQDGQRLNLRNLAIRENVVVSNRSGNTQNSVAENGAVAFWNRDYEVELYRDGESRVLASDTELWNTYTATDGERVIYRKHTPCCSNQVYAIVLHDGAREIELRAAGSQQPSPGRDFQLVPGWIAYTDIGNLGQRHVWLVDVTGERRQLTFFGQSSAIERLAPNGQVMLTHGGRRYLGDWGGALLEVSSALGQPYWVDGQWYVVIGRSVFRVAL